MEENLDLKFQDIMEFVENDHSGTVHSIAASEEPAERRPAMFTFEEDKMPATIKVVGVGGGGSNAVSTMFESNTLGAQFIVMNTDMQALAKAKAPVKVQIGSRLTSGRGAGANPETGKNAALEDAEKIKSALAGTDMVFITAGMGGGTGTGAAPVIAGLAREVGALTVGVVTRPFSHEGAPRKDKADAGIAELKKHVDALIVIPNDRLLSMAERNTSLLQAFKLADSVLVQAVKGISDVVLKHGHINVDFADVRTVMANRGRAVMGTGVASGEHRASEAAQKAISSPLLEDGSIKGARAVLVNVTGGEDMGIYEFNEAAEIIKQEVDAHANIIVGVVIDPAMSAEIMVTVIATGFDEEGGRQQRPKQAPSNLRDFMKVAEKPNLARKQGSFASKNDSLGIDNDDLDRPAFLRRQAD